MGTPSPRDHHIDCDFHTDQYSHECTCGVTAPKHPDFDAHVARAEKLRADMRRTVTPAISIDNV